MRRCPATSGPSATGFASSRSSCWPRSAQASIWTATTANSAGLSRRSRSSPLTPRYGDANTPSPISDLPRKAVMNDTITKMRQHYSATGLTDLSPGFIDAATYLTARCGLSDRVTFQVGDALHAPFEDAAFDAVFLQHVAMNIEDRVALYAEARRILTPGGRLAAYDLVFRDGAVVYPVPWARDTSTSFLLSEADTRTALEQAGFKAVLWRDDTQTALDWFKVTMAGSPPSGPNLGLVMGPDFPVMTGNLARNLRENRLGVLSAVLIRD